MAKIDIIPPVSKNLAPLYAKYDQNHEPGRAYMVLLPSGKVHFEVTMDGSHTFDVHHGREWIWYLPPELTRRELEAFAAKVKKLLSQVLRGIRISWDSNINEERGTLTPKAEEARGEIREKCDRLFELVESHELGVSVYEPCDYFEGDTPEDYDLDDASTDDDIRKEAEHIIRHFNGNNMMIYGDLFQILKRWVKDYHYE